MHYVIPQAKGYPAKPYSHVTSACIALEEGIAIRWEPGSGSGYDLLLVSRSQRPLYECDHRWLMDVTSPERTFAIALHETWTVRGWARNKTVPHGSWADLKPLLVALGAAKQDGLGVGANEHAYHARQEVEATEQYNDGRPLDRKDAQLGRKFRRLMEHELGHELCRTHPDEDD
jgi:hypothetical protein